MKTTEIQAMPATLESSYGLFRDIIREVLAESLENGDAITDMRQLRGDFYHALNDTLDEFCAPTGSIEAITK